MSTTSPILAPSLQHLLAGARDGAERLIAGLQKGARALAALSLNFNGHSIRAGIHGPEMSEIDAELDAAASALSRVLFDLQQRLLLDVQMLAHLARVEEVVDLEDERPVAERVSSALGVYSQSLTLDVAETRLITVDLATRLSVLANNTEITACRVGEASGAPVEVFVTMAAQMRALSSRLRAIAEDLSIFQQTQESNIEAVRVVLLEEADGMAAEEVA